MTTVDFVQASAPSMVVIHPIVLLSVVDHYNRLAKDTKKRVIGVLLGKLNSHLQINSGA